MAGRDRGQGEGGGVARYGPRYGAWNCLAMSEAYAYHEAKVKSQLHNYGAFLPRARAEAFYSAAESIQAQRVRTFVQRQSATVMTEVDALITPVWPRPAARFEEVDPVSPLKRGFTWVFNFTGMPAISVCCGFTPSGLPISLHIAYAYERNIPWRQKRPPV